MGVKLIDYIDSSIELYDGRVDLLHSLYKGQKVDLSVSLNENT